MSHQREGTLHDEQQAGIYYGVLGRWRTTENQLVLAQGVTARELRFLCVFLR